jgi:hypothetical protein
VARLLGTGCNSNAALVSRPAVSAGISVERLARVCSSDVVVFVRTIAVARHQRLAEP